MRQEPPAVGRHSEEVVARRLESVCKEDVGFLTLSVVKSDWWWVMFTCNEFDKLRTSVMKKQFKEFIKSNGIGYPGGPNARRTWSCP